MTTETVKTETPTPRIVVEYGDERLVLDFRDYRTRELLGGDAAHLAHLLVDEPTSGLVPWQGQHLRAEIERTWEKLKAAVAATRAPETPLQETHSVKAENDAE